MKTIIIGNSGSGKTWLAGQLQSQNGGEIIHLDDLFWAPGGFTSRRSENERDQLIASHKSKSAWIVEGVFADLAAAFLNDADCLIWLDLDLSVCLSRLGMRNTNAIHMERMQTENDLQALLAWAASYEQRCDQTAFSAHLALWQNFARRRIRLHSADEMADFLVQYTASDLMI